MNDREIIVAALRWHTVRARRLAIGREKRVADRMDGLRGLQLQNETSRRLTRAKQCEQAALRTLGRACETQRGGAELIEDIELLTWEAQC